VEAALTRVIASMRRGRRVEIGDSERTYTIEPVEDPVPREPSRDPKEAPESEPAEPEKVEAE
jgi:hypothetical protein